MAAINKRGGKWRAEVRKGAYYASKTFLRKENAKTWAYTVELALEDGTPAESHTLLEAIDEYLIKVTPTKKGHRWERVRLNKFKTYSIVHKRLIDLEPKDFARWRDDRLKEIKPSSVARELNIWSSLFTIAKKEWGWVHKNPISGIRKPPQSQPRNRVISEAELAHLLAYFRNSEVSTVFQLALESGMRLGEIVSLTSADVFFDHVILRDTKNGTQRSVPLTAHAQKLVKAVPFKISSGSVSTLFRRAVNDLGIENLTFHDTRHTAATRLAKVFSVLELCKIFGWKNPSHAMIYFNPSASELAEKLKNP